MKRFLLVLVMLCAVMTPGYAQETDLPELTETYITVPESANGETLTFRYPEGWSVQETLGQFLIANTNDSAQLNVTPVPEGVAGMALIIVDGASLPDEVDATAEGVATFLSAATNVRAEDDDVSASSVTVGDYDAYTLEAMREAGDFLVLVVALGDDAFAVFNGAMAAGTLDEWRPLFYAMAASLEYTPDVVPQITLGESFTGMFETPELSVLHPPEWTLTASDDGQVSFTGVIETGVDESGETVGGALAGTLLLLPPEVSSAMNLEQIATVYSDTLFDEDASISDPLRLITNGRDAVTISSIEGDNVTLVIIAQTGGAGDALAIVIGVYKLTIDADARLALARFAGTIDVQEDD